MKTAFVVGIAVAAGMVSAASEEKVTVKDHDDVITEFPNLPNPSGKVLARTHSKVTGTYRGDRLVLLDFREKTTVNTKQGPTEGELEFFYVVARGKKVALLEKPSFKLSSVMSPWPILINLVNHPKNGHGFGHCWISIPAIGFVEYFEFEDGERQPLQTGDRFEALKNGALKAAEESLDPDQPG